MAARIVKSSLKRAGRLVPAGAKGLRSRAVRLRAGETMPWHSTRNRDELIIVLAGGVHIETQQSRGRMRRVNIQAGYCAFIPQETMHQVVNRSGCEAKYIYVTGSTK